VILVDTSVWIDHLKRGNAELSALLEVGEVLAHPFVIGELALGGLQKPDPVLDALQNLPQARTAVDQEVLGFIRRNSLAGAGIGYVDAHLLASARLTAGALLWTHDKRLLAVADRMGLAA
jgi:predicted nucleic acid-binding protein